MWDLLTDESRQRIGTEGFIDRLRASLRR